MDTTKNQKLCECGCGQPAPIATRNWHKKGIKKGQPLRFVCGHHRRGKEQSRDEKIKRVKKWGVKEVAISPYLPGHVVIRYHDEQQRWYCRGGKRANGGLSSKPHARAVYEHYFGPVPKDHHVHHKSGSATKIEDDRPDNLMIMPKLWNWKLLPLIACYFGVEEAIATKCYITAVREGCKTDQELFRRICSLLLEI